MPLSRRSCISFFALFLFFVLFLTIPAFAQNKPAQCGVTCEPDPTSGSDLLIGPLRAVLAALPPVYNIL